MALATAAAFESRHFVVGFASDPLGPRAFPLLAALLIALGGAFGIASARARPGQGAGQASTPGSTAAPAPTPEPGPAHTPALPSTASAGLRTTAAVVSFLLFALLLDPLGFVAATALEFTVLAVLFGGTAVRGFLAGLVFAVLVFLLFVQGLGLALPLGIFGGAS